MAFDLKAKLGIVAKPADAKGKTPAKNAVAPPKKKFFTFLTDDPVGNQSISNPEQEEKRLHALARRIQIQGVLMIALAIIFIVAAPMLRTTYEYRSRRIGEAEGNERRLMALDIPILTKEAILSWATTTVTEVMTYNFSNYNQRLSAFKDRFTDQGWTLFVQALVQSDTIRQFQERSLVLTSAPSEPAIIAQESLNPETQEYEWHIQVPMIMTYTTNNNKSQKDKTVVRLVAVRVSTLVNPYGIAIKTWVSH